MARGPHRATAQRGGHPWFVALKFHDATAAERFFQDWMDHGGETDGVHLTTAPPETP
jgi:hypothetical protein